MSWIVDRRCAMAIVVRPRHQHAQRVADQQLGLGVDARRRLVEDQDARIERQRARERQQLLLADRQRRAALGDRRRVAARQPLDERVGVHRAPPRARTCSSSIAGLPSRMLSAIVPENRCTSCSTRLNSPRRSPRSSSRMSTPSMRDPAALHVVEPQQQVDQRRLARAGGADDADALARARPRTTRPSAPSRLAIPSPSL